jgi:high-affinity iron transporter
MLASLLIVFREVLEAGLIVGIVLAATRGIPARGAWVAGGVGAGVVGAGVVAVFAGALSDAFAGNGQEVFNASVLLVAVVMLGWHNLWMASHGREVARQIKTMGHEVSAGARSLLAVAIVVTVAVLREGAEVVLFLYGIAASSQEGWATLLAGGALGIGCGAVLSWLIYRGLLAIPVGRLFGVTSWLVALLAAGMAGQAAALLAKVDLIPSWGSEIWDTSWLIDESSIVGRALRALVGYSDRPMGVQLVAFLVVLAVLVGGARLVHRIPSRREPSAPARAIPR